MQKPTGSVITDKFVDVGAYKQFGMTWTQQGFSACLRIVVTNGSAENGPRQIEIAWAAVGNLLTTSVLFTNGHSFNWAGTTYTISYCLHNYTWSNCLFCRLIHLRLNQYLLRLQLSPYVSRS